MPDCRNWKDLDNELKRKGITMNFKTKGNTGEVQGVRFEKNGYIFNGSKIDRQFSFSKIDYQLKQNERLHDIHIKQGYNQSSNSEQGGLISGGLFDIHPQGTVYDPDEAELLKQHKFKKKKKRGFYL